MKFRKTDCKKCAKNPCELNEIFPVWSCYYYKKAKP